MRRIKIGKGLAVDSLILTLVRFVTIAISLIITKIMAVGFSLHDYGTYSQGTLIITTAAALSILGLTDGTNFFYNSCKDEKQRKRNINTIFCIQCIVGLLCAVVILASSGALTTYFENPELNSLYIFIMFMPICTNFIAMYQVLFISIGKAKVLAIRNLAISLIKLVTVAVAALVTKSVATIFAVNFITELFQILYFAVFFGKNKFYINPFQMDLKMIKPVLTYCLPLAIYILTNTLCRDINKYVVTYFTDTEQLAIFTNAAKVLPFDILTHSFATVMVPVITRFVAGNEYENSQNLYRNYLRFSYNTTWLVAFGVILCAKEFMVLLYDEKYLSGVGVFVVYILVDMIRFADLSVILRAKKKTVSLMLYAFGMLAINFVLNILFFQWFGMVGSALATFAATLVMNLLLLFQGCKIIRGKVTDLLDIKDMGITVLGMLGAAAVALLVKWVAQRIGLGFWLTFILEFGTYAVIVFALNIKKVLMLLRNMNRIKVEN